MAGSVEPLRPHLSRAAHVGTSAPNVVAALHRAARVRLDGTQRRATTSRTILERSAHCVRVVPRIAHHPVARVAAWVVHEKAIVANGRPLDDGVEHHGVARTARGERVRLVIGLDDSVEADATEGVQSLESTKLLLV